MSPPLDRKQVDKVIQSIGKRHKIISLSEIIGFEIYQIEIIERDIRDHDYLFYIEGSNRPVVMTDAEVLSPPLFTRAIFNLTRRPPNLIKYTRTKKAEWLEAIGDAMMEATQITAGIDESEAALIIDVIAKALGPDPSDDLRLLDDRPVIIDDLLHVKIKVIRLNLMRYELEKIRPKDIGRVLRGAGFVDHNTRIDNCRQRFWTMPLGEWEKLV